MPQLCAKRDQGQAETTILVIDFDVSESFGHEAGKSGKWVMHPVIHATELLTSGAITGAISLADGVSVPDCGGAPRDLSLFVPWAEDADGGVHSGNHASNDQYEIGYLAPGEYTMGYAAATEFDTEALEFTAVPATDRATVPAGGNVSVDYTITAAQCATR
jgi:hypothetical protein